MAWTKLTWTMLVSMSVLPARACKASAKRWGLPHASIWLRICSIFPRLVLKGIYHCWKHFYFSRGLGKWRHVSEHATVIGQPTLESIDTQSSRKKSPGNLWLPRGAPISRGQQRDSYCGWTKFCTTLNLWETIVCWYLQGNPHSRFRRWCRISSITVGIQGAQSGLLILYLPCA